MNFLAHILLSGDNEIIQIGNFSAEWIKGRLEGLVDKYSKDFFTGIKMHRFIDSFTDSDETVQVSVSRQKEYFGRYASIINDVVYDYFLAKNFQKYSNENLDIFCNKFYNSCIKHNNLLPQKVQEVIPHLILSRRLQSYESLQGLHAALKTMSETTSLPPYPEKAIEVVIKNYDAYENEFSFFWNKISCEIKKKFF